MSGRDFPSLLRKREPQKEIQPGMYYKANSALERLVEAFKANSNVVDEREELKRIGELVGLKRSQSLTRISLHSKKIPAGELAKKLRTDFHTKTHFQAAVALLHKASKSLERPSDASPKATTKVREPEDMEEAVEALEMGDLTQAQQTKTTEGTGKRRNESLPPVEALTFDNISPLRRSKNRASVVDTRGQIRRLLDHSGERYNAVLIPIRSIMKEPRGGSTTRLPRIDKRISFVLPASAEGPEMTPMGSEAEQLAKRVLRSCNVFPYRKRIDKSPRLHKGQGHTVAGFGQTNRDVYIKIFTNNK